MNFNGDPQIFFVDSEGGDIVYENGQPVMDGALHNAFSISLYTDEGFWGSSVLENAAERIGSNYEATTKLPITVSNLRRMEAAAVESLEWLLEEGVATSVSADVQNTLADRIDPTMVVTEPNGTVSKYSTNWNSFEVNQ